MITAPLRLPTAFQMFTPWGQNLFWRSMWLLFQQICRFPVITEILRGGIEKAKEAGVVIAGGHTIKDDEPKYGLMALGFAHPEKILRKGGAKVGDVLLLSKPLGTGVITTALKQDKVARTIWQALWNG